MARPLVRGFTVDPPGARDLDDAIWVEKTHDGFAVHVTVPDATAYIPIGGKIDRDARKRLATKYRKGGASHMLPRELAEYKLSLLPGQERKTITITLIFDSNLRVEPLPEVRFTRLISEAKLAYSDIPMILADRDHDLRSQLLQGTVIAKVLAEQRKKSGSVGLLDLPDGWVTTEEGVPRKLLESHHAGHLFVREPMVAVNTAFANLAVEEGFDLTFRNHRNGVREKDIDLTPWLKPGNHLPDIHDIQGMREFFGNTRAARRARYGIHAMGHDGLNVRAYTRGTSPIRRFVDLVVHRQLKAYMRGREYPYTRRQLADIARSLNASVERLGEEKPEMHRMWEPSPKILDDYVTKLYNYAWITRIRIPKFTDHWIEGADSDSQYVVICEFNGVKRTASGPSRSAAKQAAAKAVYKRLRL